ncbi:MAG: hypothetical protein KDC84_01635 [Crocinitomicaceae bacterium]|nr:hypothetical protein [Crocinitomicaceae bacterium]
MKKKLSDKDFSDYFSGKMNDRQAHEFEARATDDDFISDATDGYLDHPEGLEKLGELKSKFYEKNKISSGFSSKSILILSSAALLFVVFSVILVTKWNTPEKNVLTAENTDIKKDPKSMDTTTQVQSEIPKDPITEEARIIEQEKPVTPEKVIIVQKEIKEYEEELPIEKLEKKNVLTLDINNKEKKIQKKKIAYLYLADFKVADYSEIYRNSQLPQDELGGLPAEFEKEKRIMEGDKPKMIAYEDYLESALRLLKKEDLAESIQMLEKIGKTFPNDLNASFYQGIAYFNLKDYENAQLHFTEALSAPYFIFDDESEWYLYLCKKALGQKSEASQILKRIKDRKGFYFERALKEKI